MSFTNQGLKGVSQNHNVELLEKFQAVTKADVLAALKTHFLPLFDAQSSVAVVVTAPGKADEVSDELGKIGFDVERRTLQVEADEDGSESGSEFSEDEDSDDVDMDRR